MKVLNDFKCPNCGEVHEKLVHTNVFSIKCKCGTYATRMMSSPTIKLEGISGAFPGAHSKWATIRENNALSKSKRSYAG